jgi:hypothetical protein
MPYDFYRVLHFTGFFFTFFALGILWLHLQQASRNKTPAYKWAMAFHGIGITAILVAGFGMMAKAKVPWENWLSLKLGLWFLLAISPALLKRVPGILQPMVLIIPLIGVVAAYAARYRF